MDGHQGSNEKTTVKLYQLPVLPRNEQCEGYQQRSVFCVDAIPFVLSDEGVLSLLTSLWTSVLTLGTALDAANAYLPRLTG